MFFRIRVTLADCPGALAALATELGAAGVNILALQAFPDLGRVTDELVVRVPIDLDAAELGLVVGRAGGLHVTVTPTSSHDVNDQTLRWLRAAQEVLADAATLPEVVGSLLGNDRRAWSATEHVRAEALADLADLGHPTTDRRRLDQVTYAIERDGVRAAIAGHVIGAARFVDPPSGRLRFEVAPAWRRLGVGTRLLRAAIDVRREAGGEQVVLVAPADDESLLPFLAAAGIRGVIKLSGTELSVRIQVVPQAIA